MKKIQLGGHRYKNRPIRGYAIIDDEDFDELSKFRWHICAGYARRNAGKEIVVYMHRQLLNVPKGLVIDHINGNRLDNRKENLRVCTRAQNTRNSRLPTNNVSGYKGVSWHKHQRRWCAKIVFNAVCKHLGYYKSKVEAAVAYNEAAVKYFGEFANLNKCVNANARKV